MLNIINVSPEKYLKENLITHKCIKRFVNYLKCLLRLTIKIYISVIKTYLYSFRILLETSTNFFRKTKMLKFYDEKF